MTLLPPLPPDVSRLLDAERQADLDTNSASADRVWNAVLHAATTSAVDPSRAIEDPEDAHSLEPDADPAAERLPDEGGGSAPQPMDSGSAMGASDLVASPSAQAISTVAGGFTWKAVVGAAIVGFGVGGVAGGAAVHGYLPPSTAPTSVASTTSSVSVPPPSTADPTVHVNAPLPNESHPATSSRAPIATSSQAPSTKLPPSAGKRSRPATALDEERELIDVAQAALARKRIQDARSALSEHARRFPDGQMAPERRALEQRARLLETVVAPDDGSSGAPEPSVQPEGPSDAP